MGYMVKKTDLTKLSLNEPDLVTSVLQNVAILLNSFKGECPMFRDFGLSSETLHRPINVARTLLQADIIEQIEKYEPRAVVTGVTFEVDPTAPDRLVPTVELEVEDGS